MPNDFETITTSDPNSPPTPEVPMLVGIAVDVSGSMRKSIRNESGRAMTRIEGFEKSLDQLIDYSRKATLEGSGEAISPRIKLIAYGFGFENPLSIFFGQAGPAVRDLLSLPKEEESCVTLDYLARNWSRYQTHLKSLAGAMFGGTPLCGALREVRKRFKSERQRQRLHCDSILFLLSDGIGDATDGSPQEAINIAKDIKLAGTWIVSCYVTNADIAEPKRLYGKPPAEWDAGAQLMFNCSSPLTRPSQFESYLTEYEWTVDSGAKLFKQINQSEDLTDFMKLILGPIEAPRVAGTERIKVFVSYSHQDKEYLGEDSLLGFLSGLNRSGFRFWHDERIATGELWDERIRTEIADSDVALTLISQAFLNSAYCRNVEVSEFMRLRKERGLRVYPIILSPCSWKEEPWLAATQVQPVNGQSIERDYKERGERKHLYLKIREELKGIGEAAGARGSATGST